MIYSLTVGRNEVHRYLAPVLQAAKETFDSLFFYDDQSTDQTPEIAREYANVVFTRRPETPRFLEHEGLFRQGAWDAFETSMQPRDGDWVFVLDCDEVLVGTGASSPKAALNQVVNAAVTPAVHVSIPEVWGFEGDKPLVRVDRLWGTIFAPRLFRYRPNGQFARTHFGVPAVPMYVMAGAKGQTDQVSLLHYGYADPEDRQMKYKRYKGEGGHSNSHVDSIVSPPTLELWAGPYDVRVRRNGDR